MKDNLTWTERHIKCLHNLCKDYVEQTSVLGNRHSFNCGCILTCFQCGKKFDEEDSDMLLFCSPQCQIKFLHKNTIKEVKIQGDEIQVDTIEREEASKMQDPYKTCTNCVWLERKYRNKECPSNGDTYVQEYIYCWDSWKELTTEEYHKGCENFTDKYKEEA